MLRKISYETLRARPSVRNADSDLKLEPFVNPLSPWCWSKSATAFPNKFSDASIALVNRFNDMLEIEDAPPFFDNYRFCFVCPTLRLP